MSEPIKPPEAVQGKTLMEKQEFEKKLKLYIISKRYFYFRTYLSFFCPIFFLSSEVNKFG